MEKMEFIDKVFKNDFKVLSRWQLKSCSHKILLIALLFFLANREVKSQQFSTIGQIQEYFDNNITTIDPVEGFWSLSYSIKIYDSANRLIDNTDFPQSNEIAICRSGSLFDIYYLDDKVSLGSTTLRATANPNVYLFRVLFDDVNLEVKADAILKGGSILEYSYKMPLEKVKRDLGRTEVPKGIKVIFNFSYVKIFPTAQTSKQESKRSGTGFAISSDGIIATNYHVIKNAKNIRIRGINGDFSRSYNAILLLSDVNNDIAILQVRDLNSEGIGTPPYIIRSKPAQVGESIFVLGYPLTSTMGEEIKLTNGVISSRSGYQGDVTSYQVSAAVQPGNSGGPLFDDSGNVIGIISAKHNQAENVSYAVKIFYFETLLSSLTTYPKVGTVNKLADKSLAQQVDLAKKYLYIIEVE